MKLLTTCKIPTYTPMDQVCREISKNLKKITCIAIELTDEISDKPKTYRWNHRWPKLIVYSRELEKKYTPMPLVIIDGITNRLSPLVYSRKLKKITLLCH